MPTSSATADFDDALSPSAESANADMIAFLDCAIGVLFALRNSLEIDPADCSRINAQVGELYQALGQAFAARALYLESQAAPSGTRVH